MLKGPSLCAIILLFDDDDLTTISAHSPNGKCPKSLNTNFSYHISSVIRQRLFSFQNNPQNLDPSYKMDLDLRLDGWMTCDFTSFSTVFQSYQDDGRLIMKAMCNGTLFTVKKISPRGRIELSPLEQ